MSDIRLFDSEGKERTVHNASVGSRPSTYPFRMMRVDDYFTVPAPADNAERRVASMRLYTATSQFGRRNPEFRFSVHHDDKNRTLVVTRAA